MDQVTGTGRRLLAAVVALALTIGGLAVTTARAATPSAVDIDDACVDAPGAGFDDTDGTTFEFEIDCLAWYEITQGTGDGSQYEPALPVRRWQMATFIFRLAQIFDDQRDEFDLPTPDDQGFDDIGDLDPEFQDAINVLAEIDVVEGKTPTRFDPFANIRRDQMASFLNRLQGVVQDSLGEDPDGFSTGERFFPDVDSSNVHHRNVNGLASVGIVQGRADGRYRPAAPVTRGQMAAFIMRFVEVNVDRDVIAPKTDDPGLPDITAAGVIDTDLNGGLDLGDTLQLGAGGDPEELMAEGPPELIELRDGDGTTVRLSCGSVTEPRCTVEGGWLYAAVGEDNLLVVQAGDEAGLELSSAVLERFEDGGGDPLDILDDAGDLDVLGDDAVADDVLAGILGDLLTGSELEDLLAGGGLLPGLQEEICALPEVTSVVCDLLP